MAVLERLQGKIDRLVVGGAFIFRFPAGTRISQTEIQELAKFKRLQWLDLNGTDLGAD